MRFDTIQPIAALRPFVKRFVISENHLSETYTVLPSTGLVAGFQYKGSLALHRGDAAEKLSTAGITGLGDGPRKFANSADTGTILVYFTETGISFFTKLPIHELFNQSVPLAELFNPVLIDSVEAQIAEASYDQTRISIVENFLVEQIREIEQDRLVAEAVRLIHASKGALRIAGLCEKLHTSASPLEKRFRQRVGTTPKKFASIVRFNAALNDMSRGKSLADLCYENNFFDHAHFIRDFSRYAGQTPEQFRRGRK